jgi:chromosomal replication initiation ATPase DnaA
MSQYALPISLPPVFSEDNFVVSESNRAAYEWVTRWPDWPSHALILVGATGAGKSHLAQLWIMRSGAQILDRIVPDAKGNLLLENIEQIIDERALLHLLNYGKENKQSLLLTSELPPGELPFTLSDLTSRLKALPVAAINPPDDALLAAALRKQFADRQLKVEEEIIAYLLPRFGRSFADVAATVAILDRQALAEQRNLTIPFVKRVLNY